MNTLRWTATIATSAIALFVFGLFAVPQVSGAEFRCGAIALSKDNKHFGATRVATCEQAEQIVLKACREQSQGDCKAMTCRNSCCALAMGPKGGTGSHVGTSKQAAEKGALDFCAQHSAGCKIVRAHCNFGDGGKIDN